MKYYFY